MKHLLKTHLSQNLKRRLLNSISHKCLLKTSGSSSQEKILTEDKVSKWLRTSMKSNRLSRILLRARRELA
jgi:hypothetical protein